MPQVLDEREPGVYVRSNRPENELDFLWDRDRRRDREPDRFHLGFFAGGFVVGSVLTLSACLLFFWGGNLMPQNTSPKEPIVEEQVLTPQDLKTALPKPENKQESKIGLPFFQNNSRKEDDKKPEPKARLYEVQPGDTLGSIAIKFYDSSAPEYVEKIQQANKLDSADTLQVGQRLSIPPKNY